MTIPKFRVWDEVSCTMITTNDYEDLSDLFCCLNADDGFFSELMQSTGMKDKNGVDIYDNDIVAVDHGDFSEYGRVFYSEKFACYRVEFENYDFELNEVAYCFVVGNVYENPELLDEVGIV